MIVADRMNIQYPSHQINTQKNIHLSLVEPRKGPQYLTRYDQLSHISALDESEFRYVTSRYAFRTNSYYLSLVNWSGRQDPIRKIIIPDKTELEDWGRLDASHEHLYSKVPGLEHKYPDTALLLVTDMCGGFCRFCFRKRLFMDDNYEASRNINPGLEYIRNHKEITNVLLTGGDPLILSTERLRNIIQQIRQIDHVRIIRIGSKIPAFNPYRILNDARLIAVLKEYSLPTKRIYIMTHFNHPKELTGKAIECVNLLVRAGVIVANQTPLLRGVNDNPAVLSELFQKCSFAGLPPYYVFQGRPTAGNHHFAVPVEQSIAIFEKARKMVAGLAKRARLVMSHATGKIEIIGKMNGNTFFRYFRATDPELLGKLFVFKSNPEAYWFDDYAERVA